MEAVAAKKVVSRRYVAGRQVSQRMALTVDSSTSAGPSAWHDLVTLAELLLMHSSMHAEVSCNAWFPSDSFVVQFQQHRCALTMAWSSLRVTSTAFSLHPRLVRHHERWW